MRNKRNITLYFERIRLLLKALKWNAYVPVLFINVIIPLINLMIYLRKGVGNDLTTSINQLLQIFIPFLSCWWCIFIFRFFYEDHGAEILFVNSNRNKLIEILPLFLIMLIDIAITTFPYIWIVERFIFIFLRIILVCIFYLGISILVTMVTKSITPTLLILLVYTLANLLSPLQETVFPFYYAPEVSPNLLLCEIPLALFGLVFIGISVFLSKGKYK